MPALRIFAGEAQNPSVDQHGGHFFDRLPIAARKDPRLSAASIILLAAIVPKGGSWPDWVELEDTRLQEETGQSRSAVHRHLKQLELTGWIMRVRRRGHRKIYLLFDLAGQARCAPILGHACTSSGTSAPHLRYIHAPDSGQQDLKGEKDKDFPKGSPSATSPLAGGSPTTTPGSPEQTQAKSTGDDPATWTEADAREWQALAADPKQPFRNLAVKRLAEYFRIHEQRTEEEGSPAAGPPARETRLPGLRDKNPVRDDSTKFDASGQRE